MGRQTSIIAALIVACGALVVVPASSQRAFAEGSTPPTGLQHVLVIPIEFPSCGGCIPLPSDPRYCPNTSIPCPNSEKYLFAPPRHAPSTWTSMLDSTVSAFWHSTTYGQLSFAFTALRDPFTSDGWFPAPHPVQLYQAGNWAASSPQLPYAADVAKSAIDTVCSDPTTAATLNCGNGKTQFPHNFDRLVIMNNWQGFGGQSNSNGVPYTFSTSTVGDVHLTSTVTNEGGSDVEAEETIEHELGHQLGELSHYGDCGGYPPPTVNSFECISGWDIMGTTPCHENKDLPPDDSCGDVQQLGGYSRVSLGYVDPSTTLTLSTIAPFTQGVSLNPLEIPPDATHANIVRLSPLPLTWIFAEYGFQVDCRERVAGDNGIPDEGVLIENVHEASALQNKAPAYHYVRDITSTQDNLGVALHPGDTYAIPGTALQVRFNGYSDDPAIAPARHCLVTIANAEKLPGKWAIEPEPPLVHVLNGGGAGEVVQPSGSLRNLTPDVGNDRPLPPDAIDVAGPFVSPVDPPWVGHANLAQVRVHNVGGAAIGGKAKLSVAQGFTGTCGQAPTGSSLKFGKLDAGGAATSTTQWKAPANTSGIVLTASVSSKGSPLSVVQNGFAFQYHDTPGMPETTTFTVTAAHSCHTMQTFDIEPVAPDGWNVDVSSPEVVLRPGASTTVTVTVTAPVGVAPGYASQIPVLVEQPMKLTGPAGSPVGCTSFSFCQVVHFMPVGTMNVFARVVNSTVPAVQLVCPTRAPRTQPMTVSVETPDATKTVLVEFTAPNHKPVTEIASANPASGLPSASVTPTMKGTWTAIARWAGDDTNAPAESQVCSIAVS
jgi:hypothetical protein